MLWISNFFQLVKDLLPVLSEGLKDFLLFYTGELKKQNEELNRENQDLQTAARASDAVSRMSDADIVRDMESKHRFRD